MAEKPKKKRNPLMRLVTLILTIALLLGAGALVIFRDKWNIDALVRAIRYRSIERSDSGEAVSFEHSGRDTDSYAQFGENLLLCSAHYLRLYSQSGTLYIDESIAWTNPVIRISGEYAIVFDAGGSEFFLLHARSILHRETLSDSRTLVSASVAENGQYALATTQRGYRVVVDLYRSAGNLAVSYKRSSEFISDCALSSDGSMLVILSIGQDTSSYRSSLQFYPQGQSEPTAQVDLLNNVVIDLAIRDNVLWAVGDQALTAIDMNGTQLGAYDYSDGFLKSYSLDGDGYAALLIGRYRAGSLAQLVQVSAQGDLLGEQTVNEQILSLSCAGRYTGILTYDSFAVYLSGFAEYARYDSAIMPHRALLRKDGSALLISDRSAQLYLPE